MANPPVVDASPLILLAHGGAFDLLRATWESILVPSSVATEIRRRGPTDPTVLAMNHASWLTMIQDSPIPPAILSWDLGMGNRLFWHGLMRTQGLRSFATIGLRGDALQRSAYPCEELSHWCSVRNNAD